MTTTIARRFLRSRRLRASAAPALVVAAVVAAMYVLLQAQALSGEQVADRDLGRFDHYAGFGVAAFRPGSEARTTLRDAVAPVTGPEMDVSLVVNGLSLPALRDGSLTYSEMDWTAEPFPAKYELLSGRWPSAPGEIAIVEPRRGSDPRPLPQPVLGYGGRAAFEAVGTVDDRFDDSVAVIAAPGTWAALEPRLGRASPVLRAQPVVYWTGNGSEEVLQAIALGYRELLPRRGPERIRDELAPTYASRFEVEAHAERSWIEQSPAGYTIPSLLLPILAVLAIFALNARRLRPAITTMTAVGLPERTATGGAGLALTAACLAASLTGAVAGLVGGSALARAVAAAAGEVEPGLPDVFPPLLRLLATTLAGCALGWVALRQPGRQRAGARDPAPPRHRRAQARRLLAAAAVISAVVQVPYLRSAPQAMIVFGVAAFSMLLLLPDAVPSVLRRLPENTLRARLSKRQLLGDSRRATALVSVLAVLIGTSTGFVALLDTMIRTAGAQVYPDVLPGQVKVADRGTDLANPPKAALAAARTVPALEAQTPVRMRFVADLEPSGSLRSQVRAGGEDGLLLAVETPAELERLTGKVLSPAQERVLGDGGALFWSPRLTGHVVDLRLDRAGAARPAEAVPVRARRAAMPVAEWNLGTVGAVLAATARERSWPLASGAVMYTGLPDGASGAVRTALDRAGLDPEFARGYRTPPPPIPPLALYLTAVGLVAGTLLLTLFFTRAQVRSLRDHLGHLVALGLRPRWVRLVALRQHAVLVGMGTALGVVLGVTTAVVAAWRIPGFVLSIPWGQLAVLVGSILAAGLAATVLATRSLRAREHWSEPG